MMSYPHSTGIKPPSSSTPSSTLAMTQLQDLARYLAAAGGAKVPDIENTHLLYVEDSTLFLKEWDGTKFDTQESITTDILPDSPAIYLPSEMTNLIICVSSASTLRALIYNDDSGEWEDDESLGQHKVHPSGGLAGTISEEGDQHVFFQDLSNRLTHLDGKWNPTILSAHAVKDSPLTVLEFDNTVHLFHVSATDNCIHYLSQQQDNTWNDSTLTAYAFNAIEKPKRFFVSPDDAGALEVSVLAEHGDEDAKMFRISATGEKTDFGTVNKAGNLKPTTDEECFIFIKIRLGRMYRARHRVRIVMY
ncbi:hypothetical protein FPV67DRAFT_619934 [Lyophyllum atratum]|nr:hypothetical protein FPV67DRAFT_619934 [Lyophyllum atratum]